MITTERWGDTDFPSTCKTCGLVFIPGTDRCAECDSLKKEVSALQAKIREKEKELEQLYAAIEGNHLRGFHDYSSNAGCGTCSLLSKHQQAQSEKSE